MRIASSIVAVCAALLLMGRPAEGQETADIGSLLPADEEIPGWKTDGEPLSYTAENLWEYINGAADNFLSFDFQRVVAQNYRSIAGRELKAEIYEHGSPLMAYGIYAQMRSPGLVLHDLGIEAFSDEYSINVWKDRFYVRVAVFDKGEDGDEAKRRFARAIADSIPGDGGELPPETGAFPEEGLVPNDLRYITAGVLGRSKFPPAFVGTYMLKGEPAKLYIAALADSAAARDTFQWYTDEMESFLAKAEGENGDYILGTGVDPYQGDVVVFTCGRYLGVLVGAKDQAELGMQLAKKTVGRLRAIDIARTKRKP